MIGFVVKRKNLRDHMSKDNVRLLTYSQEYEEWAQEF